MLMLCKKTINHEFFLIQRKYHRILWLYQQRLQISELHFDKFHTRSSFSCWKIRFKTQVSSCSDFPSGAMSWIKEVEMADSVDELKSSRSIAGKDCPHFRNFETAGCEDSVCSEQDHPEFLLQEEGQSRGTETSKKQSGSVSSRKTDRLHDLRLLSSYWRS